MVGGVGGQRPRAPQGNATLGTVVLDAVSDCLVFAEGGSVAVHGGCGLAIVATPERVLVVPRLSDPEGVRDLADRVDRALDAS